MTTVIQIENLWKEYRLGVIGHGTLRADLQSWWARLRGGEDPNKKIPLLSGQEKQIEGDHFWALRGIDLEVEQGEILGIIGKNGAGKSTLLKILSRVTAPSQGSIKVKGRIASLLEVGTGFHKELTGRENIFMNGAILGMSKQEIKSKLDEIIDFSGVEDFIETPVKRYSSGMYVRLAFAVAAHLEPEIMIVDEVLAVGDAEFQKKCLGKMKEVSGQGRTVLFVSHNLISVKALCTRCVEVSSGTIVNSGMLDKIIQKYLQQPLQYSTDASGHIDERASLHNTGHIKFRRIRLLNREGMSTDKIEYRSELVLKIELDSDDNYSDLIYHIYLNSMDGQTISYATNLYEDIAVTLKKGPNDLQVTLSNNVQPGKYCLSVSVSKADGTTMDYVENILKFEIIVTSVINRAIKWKDPYRGMVVMDSDWNSQ